MDDELNLYFVLFSIHKGKEWTAHAGYIFAKCPADIQLLLNRTFGETLCRSMEKIRIEEGTVLYGERWHKL